MKASEEFSSEKILEKFKVSMAHSIVGQDTMVELVFMCFIANGHVLIEGLPGLAKTLLAKTFANLLGVSFKRIQFSPDILPSDIIGTLVFRQNEGRFAYRRGPIFSNVILLDEINRAPAKVQAALLESMEEKQVTLGRRTYSLPVPFFVLATENPMEEEGTYPLSEAQKDRFLMKLISEYPSKEDEVDIMERAALKAFLENTLSPPLDVKPHPVFTHEELLFLRSKAKDITVKKDVSKYIISIVSATRANTQKSSSYSSYISTGASPRASIAIYCLSKILAMLRQRSYVIPEDIKYLSLPILRHRIRLSYDAIADGVSTDEIIKKILETIPQP